MLAGLQCQDRPGTVCCTLLVLLRNVATTIGAKPEASRENGLEAKDTVCICTNRHRFVLAPFTRKECYEGFSEGLTAARVKDLAFDGALVFVTQ